MGHISHSHPYGFPCGSAGKESTCNAGDLASIPGLGRSPGEGKGYLLQYSGLENSTDCIVHGVTKSPTQLSDFHFHHRIFMRNKWYSVSEVPHGPCRGYTLTEIITWADGGQERLFCSQLYLYYLTQYLAHTDI